MINISIERIRPDELETLVALLGSHHLPTDGLFDHLPTTLVARSDGEIVGSAALELYGDAALLRSVAVSTEWQGRHVGDQLTRAALQLAHESRVTHIYLLTTTASHYFPRFGFEEIERADVPSSVQTSIEFTAACPSSATVMRKRIN
jgi:amino-acid N-acetyltransferase